jgi:hypothetical protein
MHAAKNPNAASWQMEDLNTQDVSDFLDPFVTSYSKLQPAERYRIKL